MKKIFLLIVLLFIPTVIAFDEYIYLCYDNNIWLNKCNNNVCDADDDEFIGKCECKSIDGSQISEKIRKPINYVKEQLCKEEGVEDSCIDSDNGKIFDKKGCVSGFKNNVEYMKCDKCSEKGESLYEYYCSGGVYSMIRQPCTNGCSNGECIESAVEICDDKVDNDRDGMVDCADSDCIGNIDCVSPPCRVGDIKQYICKDGSQVDWCTCMHGAVKDDWVCINSPETQCKGGNDIIFWIVLVIVIGGVGGTIYYLFFRKKKSRR